MSHGVSLKHSEREGVIASQTSSEVIDQLTPGTKIVRIATRYCLQPTAPLCPTIPDIFKPQSQDEQVYRT